jgi:hypothetical protein
MAACNSPSASIAYVSNLWSKMMVFTRKGDTEQGHAHTFDHLTLLAHGALQVTIDGVASEFKAPHMIYIKKDKVHELVALEDNTVAYCIHALRDIDGSGDILDPDMIPKGAYPIGTVAASLLNEPPSFK